MKLFSRYSISNLRDHDTRSSQTNGQFVKAIPHST